MPTETKTQEINGTTYIFEQFGGKQALRVQLQCAKLLGPALERGGAIAARLAMASKGQQYLAIANVIGALAVHLDIDLFEIVVEEFAQRTKVQTTVALTNAKSVNLPLDRDKQFSGAGQKDFYNWLGWVFEAQFGDFLGEISPRQIWESLLKDSREKSQPSTGDSTES